MGVRWEAGSETPHENLGEWWPTAPVSDAALLELLSLFANTPLKSYRSDDLVALVRHKRPQSDSLDHSPDFFLAGSIALGKANTALPWLGYSMQGWVSLGAAAPQLRMV